MVRTQKRTRGERWQRLRESKLYDQPLCEACSTPSRPVQAEQVDHKIPLFQGGTDEWGNLQSLCIPCHRRKTITERGDRIRQGADVTGWPIDSGHHWNR